MIDRERSQALRMVAEAESTPLGYRVAPWETTVVNVAHPDCYD
jgi:hypothetical protein